MGFDFHKPILSKNHRKSSHLNAVNPNELILGFIFRIVQRGKKVSAEPV